MNADVIYGLICLHAHVCIEAVIQTQLLLCVTNHIPRGKSKVEQCLIVLLLQSFPPCMAADTVSFTPSTVADSGLSDPVHHHSTIMFLPRICRPLKLNLHQYLH